MLGSDSHESEVDHIVWKAFYHHRKWDDHIGELYAVSKDRAMELIAEEADVENEGWETNDTVDYELYQLWDTEHHVVTVTEVSVYA